MKTLYLLLLCSALLFSSQFNQKFNTITKKAFIYVKNTHKTQKLYLSFQLKFPYSFDVPNSAVKKQISSKIYSFIREFKKQDPKKMLKEEFGNDDAYVNGNWYDNNYVSIYSILPNSFTIQEDEDSYLGGAHGLFSTYFYNYTPDGKKIKLSDVVNNIKDFTKEVEKYYKEYYNIAQNTALSDIDWFEDKFVLAKEFALDRNGIFFIYNHYEIKAYGYGQTELLVPYSRVKKYINSKYLPKEEAKKIYNLNDYIKLIVTKLPNQKLQLTLKVKSPKNSKKAWVSMAFPAIYSKSAVLNVKNSGFKKVSIYPKGSKIYNKKLHKAISSKYLLVEGYAKNWQKDIEKSINLTIKTNKKGFIDIRAVFDKSEIPEYSNIIGQQGFDNFRIYYEW